MAVAGHDPNYIAALLWKPGGTPLRWQGRGGAPVRIEYSFYDAGQPPPALGAYGGVQSPDEVQRNGLRAALKAWEQVANVTFVERAGGNAPLRIAYGDLPGARLGVTHVECSGSGTIRRAEIWLDTSHAYMADPTVGTFAHFVAIHEIGHVLGLGHPFDQEPKLGQAFDHAGYTVMSYEDHPGTGRDRTGLPLAPRTPMLYDIAAVQFLYGAARTASGDDRYVFGDGLAEIRTIWDSGGTDTIDASGQLLPVTIDLGQGAGSDVGRRGVGRDWAQVAEDNIRIAFGTVIENAIGGAGDDILIGNAAENRLDGGAGNDVLRGGGGKDTFVFSDHFGTDRILDIEDGEILLFTGIHPTELAFLRSGDDLHICRGGDRVVIEACFGVARTLIINGAIWNVEDLARLPSPQPAAFGLRVTGGEGGDTLQGAAGDDELFGHGGNDRLFGGDGADILAGGDGHDRLDGGTGADVLKGGAGNDRLFGRDGADILAGGDGHDRLDGGTGADVLKGGAGNDRLFGRDGADTLLGGTGTDRLCGGDGADILLGGDGHDRLDGGAGNDIFVGDPGNDRILGGPGTDILYLSGVLTDFRIKGENGRYQLIDLEPGDGDLGRDIIQDVEFLQFADARVDLTNSWPSVLDSGATFASPPIDLDLLLSTG